jgi:hypothetical protein
MPTWQGASVAYLINFLLIWGGIAAGLVAAALWYRAARIVVRKGDPRAARDIFLGGVAIQTTAREQSRYNQYAALATALSVLLQTGASYFNHW